MGPLAIAVPALNATTTKAANNFFILLYSFLMCDDFSIGNKQEYSMKKM